MVKVRLSVLDLKPIKRLFTKPDLTLTFDPSTLTSVQLRALINANVMCENDQDPCLPLVVIDPPKSLIVAYANTTWRNSDGALRCGNSV